MEKKILIACAMQQDEIEKYRKQLNITYPVVYLQRGLHRNPSVLRNLLQQEIDRHQDVDIILLTYGLCGRGTEGIVSWNTELVMPRFHDCIHQLLENHVDKNSLYATRAWTIDKESIGGQCSTVLAAYGRERGMEVLDTIYGGYEKITLIDTTLPNAEKLLMDDPKETAEHATIVDLIRNDLSMVANRVSVSRYRYMDRLQTNRGVIFQTSSEIQGILPENYQEHLGDIIFRLLPAGSITGAPKRKTMQIIQEAETYDRGFYTGVMGYSDGIDLDSAVMIRFVEQEGEKMYFKSGGGITCQSDVESEYNEMKQKVYVPIY